MSLCRALLVLPVCAALASPAVALTFNLTQIQGDTLTVSEAAAFQTAAAAWSAVLTDPVTVNVSIGFRDLGTASNGGTILGATSPDFVTPMSYAAFESHYIADETSAADAQAAAYLPSAVPGGTVMLTSAEARALGFSTAAGTDGSIEFTSNSGIQFADTRTALNGGNYDLTGIAEHEIAHLLGFDSAIDSGGSIKTVLDLFRDSAPATPSFQAGQPAYFSLDGGTTDLASFSIGGLGQYQASHWLQGSGGLLDPAVTAGHEESITPLDITALDVLGYNLAGVAVVEPASMLLLASALLMLTLRRRLCRVTRSNDTCQVSPLYRRR